MYRVETFNKRISELEDKLQKMKTENSEKEREITTLRSNLRECDEKLLSVRNTRKSRSRERMAKPAISDNLIVVHKDSVPDAKNKIGASITPSLDARRKSTKGVYEIYSQCLKQLGSKSVDKSSKHEKHRYNKKILNGLSLGSKARMSYEWPNTNNTTFIANQSMLHSYKHSFSIQSDVKIKFKLGRVEIKRVSMLCFYRVRMAIFQHNVGPKRIV